jgi:hypothetical protein
MIRRSPSDARPDLSANEYVGQQRKRIAPLKANALAAMADYANANSPCWLTVFDVSASLQRLAQG